MKEINQSSLLEQANLLLSKDLEGKKLLEYEKNLGIKSVICKSSSQKIKEITHISDWGEGSLRYFKIGETYHLDRIDASPAGSGIGSILYGILEDRAQEENIISITARVSEPNGIARKFFQNKGFEEKEKDESVFPPEIKIKKDLFYCK